MPPCVRDRWVHRRVRRGSWYSSWASSTCRRPSCVRACCAKMSRIRPERSRILTPSSDLEALLLVGRQLVVRDQQREAGLGLGLVELLGLALADVPVRVDMAPVLPLGTDHLRARGVRQAGQLAERLLGGPALVVARVDGKQKRLLDGRHQIDHGGAGGRGCSRGHWTGQNIGRGRIGYLHEEVGPNGVCIPF